VIVLDTTILVYAVGTRHALAAPSRRVIEAAAEGRVRATTTAEVVQEFVHVRARGRSRRDAVRLGRAYAELLSPLVTIEGEDLDHGFRLFERHARLGAFDAVLAAAAISRDAEALVSADAGFDGIPRLTWIAPGVPELDDLLQG
jgi:hypothetical protein